VARLLWKRLVLNMRRLLVMCPRTNLCVTPPCDYWVAPASSPIMALSPALRILSHNVRGLVERVDVISLVRAWWDAGACIVCFQETWADCQGGLSSEALTLFLDDKC
jgi:hypothetical protein